MKKLLTLVLCLTLLGGCALRKAPFSFSPEVYLEVNGQEITSPTKEDLQEGLKGLDSSEESYVYLELGKPVDGMWYLSAALPLEGYEDGLGYILEACIEAGAEDFAYLQYRTTDQDQVLTWFENFFTATSAPDTSQWTDISYWYYDDPGGYDYGYDYYKDDEIRAI